MAFDPFTAGFDLIKTGLDKFFPDANEELRGKLAQAAQEINNQYLQEIAQIEVNKIEASNPSVFVSGWRPMVGWVCGASLAYVGLLEPLARFVATVIFGYVGVYPVIDTSLTVQILLGLLGLGGLRSFDKVKGTETKMVGNKK
jgi:Holin of 3TMs, for gene-transfer release